MRDTQFIPEEKDEEEGEAKELKHAEPEVQILTEKNLTISEKILPLLKKAGILSSGQGVLSVMI